MKARQWVFAILSGLVLLMGLALTAYSLAWTQGRVDLFIGFSVAISAIGAIGLFTSLRGSKGNLN